MPHLEIYLLLFTDTLVSNFAFNNSAELAIFSMKVFGFYNPYIVIITASVAAAIAYGANYLLGIACYKILAPMNNEESGGNNSKRIEAIRANKFLPLLIILSGVPFFGKFIILFAGFCRVPALMTIALGALAKFIYYIITYLIL